MVRIDGKAIGFTTDIPDEEVAGLLGIACEDAQIEAAYEAIDWDAVADELASVARALVAKQGAAARAAVASMPRGAEPATRDIPTFLPLWCRFDVVPAEPDGRDWWPPLDIDDIRPALDAIAVGDLPAYGEDFHHVRYGCGDGLVAAAKAVGLIDGDEWQKVSYDGIDESAYEDYYDARRSHEGLPAIER